MSNSVKSYIDVLSEGMANSNYVPNQKLLKHWKPSKFTLALLHRVHGFATGMHRRSTYINSQKIVWLEGGNPHGEPLLLIHGFASNKENWIMLLPFLVKRYRLFVPDLPGWGESTFDFTESYRIEDQISRLEMWANRYLPEDFHVVGSSMGGGIAALFAVRQPDQVRSLTLMNALGVFGDQLTYFERELQQGRNQLVAERLTDVVYMMSTATSYRRWALTAFLAPLMYQELVSRQHINMYLSHQLMKDADSDVFESIATIKQPTLIMWGENDRILHPSCADVFKQLIPHADVKILRGAGHLPMVEMPAVTARSLQKFWKNSSSQLATYVTKKKQQDDVLTPVAQTDAVYT
ncbi:MAG: alpha/beta hydrolase [Candidatus Saccharibacteria bacterium]|nr:alpha/beta hydrolase [Moraxellaceae bacterium]